MVGACFFRLNEISGSGSIFVKIFSFLSFYQGDTGMYRGIIWGDTGENWVLVTKMSKCDILSMVIRDIFIYMVLTIGSSHIQTGCQINILWTSLCW